VQLREKFNAQRPLLDEQFAARGAELFVDRLGKIINMSRDGQVEMADLIRVYLSRVERDPHGLPVKLFPFAGAQPGVDQPRSVVIDPAVGFGRPVLAGTAIPTAVLVEQFKASDLPRDLAHEYGVSEEAVRYAIRCELEPRRLSFRRFTWTNRSTASPRWRRHRSDAIRRRGRVIHCRAVGSGGADDDGQSESPIRAGACPCRALMPCKSLPRKPARR
jgi:uncharacterized protein (DUF433 family)